MRSQTHPSDDFPQKQLKDKQSLAKKKHKQTNKQKLNNKQTNKQTKEQKYKQNH